MAPLYSMHTLYPKAEQFLSIEIIFVSIKQCFFFHTVLFIVFLLSIYIFHVYNVVLYGWARILFGKGVTGCQIKFNSLNKRYEK